MPKVKKIRDYRSPYQRLGQKLGATSLPPPKPPIELPETKIAAGDDLKGLEPTKIKYNINDPASFDTSETTFEVHASDIPVGAGSLITDYDGIDHTISTLSRAFMAARRRLHWCGTSLRLFERELHEKNTLIAKYEKRAMPAPLPPLPYWEELTHEKPLIQIEQRMIDRLGKIIIGTVAAVFVLTLFLLVWLR